MANPNATLVEWLVPRRRMRVPHPTRVACRHRPAVRATQTWRLHHANPLVVLVNGEAALVEVEEQADVVALLERGLPRVATRES